MLIELNGVSLQGPFVTDNFLITCSALLDSYTIISHRSSMVHDGAAVGWNSMAVH